MFKIKKLFIISVCLSLFLSSSSLAFADDTDDTGLSDDTAAIDDSASTEDSGSLDDDTKATDDAGVSDDASVNNDSTSTDDSSNKEVRKLNKKVIKNILRPRIKKNFTELNEFPKGEAKERFFHALIQWGYIDKLARDGSELNWDIDLSIDNGKINLLGEPMLFEGNDKIHEQSDNSRITGITKTTRHWDGVLVRITPNDKDNANVTIKVGDFSKTYSIRELFDVHGIYELNNERQVAVRSFHKGGDLSPTRRNEIFNRKFNVIQKVEKVHEKVRGMIMNGKITKDMAKNVFYVLKRLENHEFAEGKDGKWAQKLEQLMEKLNANEDVKILDDGLEQINIDFDASCNASVQDDFNEGLVPFEDTPQCAWYTDFMRRLKNARVIKGMAGTNNAAPGSNISRAELLAISLAGAGIDVDKVADDEVADDVFDDSKNHWAERGIRYALQQGLVKGFKDGFRPNAQVTRAEALAMVYKIFGLVADDTCTPTFNDTEGHWACSIIEDAKLVGIVNGFEDGSFKPNDPITRAAMAKIISTTVDYIEITDDYDEI